MKQNYLHDKGNFYCICNNLVFSREELFLWFCINYVLFWVTLNPKLKYYKSIKESWLVIV